MPGRGVGVGGGTSLPEGFCLLTRRTGRLWVRPREGSVARVGYGEWEEAKDGLRRRWVWKSRRDLRVDI